MLFTRAPFSMMSPLVGSSSPAISRKSVDLPQPEGPTKTMNSPSSMARSTPWITSTGPKAFLDVSQFKRVGHFSPVVAMPVVMNRCSQTKTSVIGISDTTVIARM